MESFFGERLDDLMEVVGPAAALYRSRTFFAPSHRILQLTHALLAVCVDKFGSFHWGVPCQDIHKFASRYKLQIQSFNEDDLKRFVTRATEQPRNSDLAPIAGLFMMAKVQLDDSLQRHHAVLEAGSFEDFVSEAKEAFFGEREEVLERTPEQRSADVRGLRNVLCATPDTENRAYFEIFGERSRTPAQQKAYRNKIYFLCYRNSCVSGKVRKSLIEIATPASKSVDYFEFRHVYQDEKRKRVAVGPVLRFGDGYYFLGGSGRARGEMQADINDGIKLISIDENEILDADGMYRGLYMSHNFEMKPIVGRIAFIRISSQQKEGEYFDKDMKLSLIDRSLLRVDLQQEHSPYEHLFGNQLELHIDTCERFIQSVLDEPPPESPSGPIFASSRRRGD